MMEGVKALRESSDDAVLLVLVVSGLAIQRLGPASVHFDLLQHCHLLGWAPERTSSAIKRIGVIGDGLIRDSMDIVAQTEAAKGGPCA